MRRKFSLLVVLFALFVPWLAAGEAAPPPSTILIVWDGLDRPVLNELLKAGKLPNLAEIIKAGSLQDIDVKGHDTETLPGHAEMLTGLSAEVTGVKSNMESQPVAKGWSIFERLRNAPETKNVFNIMVTGKSYVAGLFPDARPALDVCDAGSRGAEAAGTAALAALEKAGDRRFCAFIHFRDPDSAGHAYGSGGPEYRAAAVECDAWLGKITAQLKKSKREGSTLIYVMADHGFDFNAMMHSNAPHSWLATNDPQVARGGTIADVPATILARFGLAVEKLEPKLLGRPLDDKPAEPKPAPAPAREPVLAPAAP